jgi:non-heme chloroperoxidase
MPYAKARDGTQLYYKMWGKGRAVYLMHGWPLTADTWDDLAIAIADQGMRAIAYDRRGFGRSDQPWAGYDYDTLADDLAAVMRVTRASREAAIIGFSMGGGEVARYMSRHEGKSVGQAALIASIVPYLLKTDDNPQGVPQSTFDEMAAGMKKDRAKFWSSFMKDFYGAGLMSSPVSDEVLEWSRRQAMMAGLYPTLKCAEAFATTDFRPDLSSFKVPTLIIHGTKDQTVPIGASALAAAKGIKGAELIQYDGAPHGLLATHKEEIARDVLAFLGQHTATRSPR